MKRAAVVIGALVGVTCYFLAIASKDNHATYKKLDTALWHKLADLDKKGIIPGIGMTSSLTVQSVSHSTKSTGILKLVDLAGNVIEIRKEPGVVSVRVNGQTVNSLTERGLK